MPPTTTLLIATYNWPEALGLVLRSALSQSTLPGQVVVADDGSGEPTANVVRDLGPRFAAAGVALDHVWHPDEGFRLAAIRNRALAAARGDYVLMVDGDCVLHPDFVASHVGFARPGTFVQGSRVLVSRERSARALAEGSTRFSLLDRGLKNRQNAVPSRLLSALVRADQDPLRGTRGCNMAYWRADAERVNGFNERFVGWGREDSEFTARMLAAGLERRKLKFGGIVFHLWHDERPRSAVDENHRLYEEIVRTRACRCEAGLDRHAPGHSPGPDRGV
ncbi:glycosyltransferase family 2 protein [Roseisolibacter sp. H3M3-2]|uniref:glycosyltransferase family 2 protein n=1 Tax=Roseisolibacter sp. H3M3-2 TaxID=3031323 RepID=UPI0023DAF790|nr:glycosyltransferase family 2 protein [Roseisolibacter sp. H3M3-2]MDF1504275.1 glycosyltransferase family 2 protein [Roseisolibacter sp. H3M3-2]